MDEAIGETDLVFHPAARSVKWIPEHRCLLK
jgi:hypothetical protein